METFYQRAKEAGPVRFYQVIQQELSMLRGLHNVNVTNARIELELIREQEGKQYFRFDMTEYYQSNQSGLFKWVYDLWTLRKHLTIEVRSDGMIGNIVNIDEVQEEWKRLRPRIEDTHRDEKSMLKILDKMEAAISSGLRLADILRYTAPFINIFPPLMDKELHTVPDPEYPGYREIEDFIGVKTIPVLTSEALLPDTADNCKLLWVNGEIDRVAFEDHIVADFVKSIRGKANVSTQVDLKYMEKHAIDRLGWVQQGLQKYIITIPGFLYREEQVVVKNISSWVKNMYRTVYS